MLATLAACGSHPSIRTAPGTSSTSTTQGVTPTTPGPTTSPPTTAVPANAGRWALIPSGPSNATPPTAWTGRELLVAHGGCCGELGSVDLTAFAPATGTWRQLPAPPLTSRTGAVGAWTGTEMIVAGGDASPGGLADQAAPAVDGAAWTPSPGTWHRIASMPVPLPSYGFATAVWTGREMLVWASAPATVDGLGRQIAGSEVVLAYNPATDSWRRLPSSGLTPRVDPVLVWTGHELVVWGGLSFQWDTAYGDGARLNPTTGAWRRLPAAPVPARGQAAAVWSGQEVLLWGGATGGAPTGQVGQGAAYSPTTNSWRTLPLSPLRARRMAAGVWTGRVFIVVGGAAGPEMPVPGPGAAAYDPATDRWATLPAAPDYPQTDWGPTGPASQRAGAIGVWTGSSALFVGGLDFRQQGPRSDGLMWTPAAPAGAGA